MRRARAGVLLLLLSPGLAGCPAAPGDRPAMTVHGLDILRIGPDRRIVLAGGLEIAGDAKLAGALAGDGAAIRAVTALERFPPVYLVTFADGDTRRYPSRRSAP